MRTSEVINGAAEVILNEGWTTGNKGMLPTGPACVMGALNRAANRDYAAYHRGLEAVWEYLVADGQVIRHNHPKGSIQLWMWNDTRPSVVPVLRALQAAAVIAEAEEARAESGVLV